MNMLKSLYFFSKELLVGIFFAVTLLLFITLSVEVFTIIFMISGFFTFILYAYVDYLKSEDND